MTSFAVTPMLASGALQFAFEKATLEGKLTIGSLIVLSLFSWTIIFTKAYQLYRSLTVTKKFLAKYSASRDPLEIHNSGENFEGAPAFHVYSSGAQELEYHLKNNPVDVKGVQKISGTSFESVKVTMEEAAGAESMSLEKGMIVLSTAVSGGPFIGLLGTVWGVMETFAGIAKAASASLTAMAPGVAGALIATVVGLLVAIPAMFAYNFMVTTIRGITQELDGFASRYAVQMEHMYVDNRVIADEIREANTEFAHKMFGAMKIKENQTFQSSGSTH